MYLPMRLGIAAVIVGLVWLTPTLAQTDVAVFVQAGEVTTDSGLVMSRCNDEADATVTLSCAAEDGGQNFTMSADVTSDTDYTVTMEVTGLESNTTYIYSVSCGTSTSDQGMFKTLPSADEGAALSFVWAADLAGQGWGRNPDLSVTTVGGKEITGGYVVFEVMRGFKPDFALFQGDMIYADGPIFATQEIPAEVGGGNWTNDPTFETVAVTLEDFRAKWKYNFGDDKMRQFLLQTPIYVQWDDHEVTNNWYPGELLYEPSYVNGTLADDLETYSKQAFYEMNPLKDGQQIYRSHRMGKHLEIFFPDYRSYRQPNTDNLAEAGTDMMGQAQLAWLMDAMESSDATWKIVSSHDPIGLVTGNEGDYDTFAQDDPAVLGRELEMRALLANFTQKSVKNVVWLTSDVHFTAAVYYDASNATFPGFDSFYEFVIGPIHAGAFGPQSLDMSFGPEYEYVRAPGTENLPVDLPPPHLQSFGYAEVSESGELTVQLVDVTGDILYEKKLEPSTDEISGGTDQTSGGLSDSYTKDLSAATLSLMQVALGL